MLSGDEIRRLGIVSLPTEAEADHVQPNGIDLSVDGVWRFVDGGVLGRAERALPERRELAFAVDEWLALPAGTYGVRYAERVALPSDCGGLCFPRSSLLRMGAHVPTAVWDAGYAGHGESLLVVTNPHGIRLQRGTRVAQLVVFRLSEPAQRPYAGHYQGR